MTLSFWPSDHRCCRVARRVVSGDPSAAKSLEGRQGSIERIPVYGHPVDDLRRVMLRHCQTGQRPCRTVQVHHYSLLEERSGTTSARGLQWRHRWPSRPLKAGSSSDNAPSSYVGRSASCCRLACCPSARRSCSGVVSLLIQGTDGRHNSEPEGSFCET